MEFMRSTQLQKPVESYSVSDEQSIQSICARERPDINDRDSLYFVLQSIAVIKMQTMTIKHSRETNKSTTVDEHRQVPAMDVRVYSNKIPAPPPQGSERFNIPSSLETVEIPGRGSKSESEEATLVS